MVVSAISSTGGQKKSNYVPHALGAAVITTAGGAVYGNRFVQKGTVDEYVKDVLIKKESDAKEVIANYRKNLLATVKPMTETKANEYKEVLAKAKELSALRAPLTAAEASYNNLLEFAHDGNMQNAYGKWGYRRKAGVTDEIFNQVSKAKDAAYSEFLKIEEKKRWEIDTVPSLRKQAAKLRHSNRVEGHTEIVKGIRDKYNTAKHTLIQLAQYNADTPALQKSSILYKGLQEDFIQRKNSLTMKYGKIGLAVGAALVLLAGVAAKISSNKANK